MPVSNENRLQLHTESLFRLLVDKCREYRYPLFSSLIWGLLSYLFIFTHKLPNHDELGQLFGVGTTLPSGRWGLSLFSLLIPQFSLPWFHGIATVLLIGTASCLIVRVFRIRSHLIQSLMAGAIIVFPSLLGTFGYMFTTIYYGISFLLAVLALWFFSRDSWYQAIPGLICAVLSVSIYQAYISILASLLVTLLLQQALYGEESPVVLLMRGLRFLLLLTVSMALYWGITLILQNASDTDMGRYASIAIENTDSLIRRIGLCYRYFWRIPTAGSRGLIPAGLLRWMHCTVLVLTAAEIAFCSLRKGRLSRLPLVIFLLAIYPMALNCIYLFVHKDAVHSLVLYGYAMIYVLAAAVADGSSRVTAGSRRADLARGLALDAVLAALALIILGNCFRSNVASLHMFFNYENNYALANSIITQVQMYPKYTHEMRVAIFGRLPEQEEFPQFQEIRSLTGVRGFHTEADTYERFWEDYCGFSVRFASGHTKEEILNTQEFQDMPTYPDQGYIQQIGHILVVKLPAAE